MGLDLVLNNRSKFPAIEVNGRLLDLSFTGARLRTDEVVGDDGDTLDIQLLITDHHKLMLSGELVRHDEHPDQCLVGVKFKSMPVTEQIKLDRVLRKFAQLDLSFLGTAPLSPFKKHPRSS